MNALRRHAKRTTVVAVLTVLAAAAGAWGQASVIRYYSQGGHVEGWAYDAVNNTNAWVVGTQNASAPGSVNAANYVSAYLANWNTGAEAWGEGATPKTSVKVSPDLQQGKVVATVPVVATWGTGASSITVNLNEYAQNVYVDSNFSYTTHLPHNMNSRTSGYGAWSDGVSGTLSAATNNGSIVVNNAPVAGGFMAYGKNTYHEVTLPQ